MKGVLYSVQLKLILFFQKEVELCTGSADCCIRQLSHTEWYRCTQLSTHRHIRGN
jgi:hypothetical protein